IDVIAQIIDNVDDRGTLFSLLTVNKQVFQYACRALYRDPFYFFRSERWDNPSKVRAQKSLAQWLLSLSPATDRKTNFIRRALCVPQKLEPEANEQPRTMLNYLSLIQCAGCDDILDRPIDDLWQPEESFCSTYYAIQRRFLKFACPIRHAFTWSIVGHRLGDIREISIQPYSVDCFIDVASQLCRLRTIVIVDPRCLSKYHTDITYPSVFRLIQAIQQHHGKNQLLDCRFTLDTRFCHDPRTDEDRPAFDWHIKITKLLPPLFPHDLYAVLPARPMDAYLSRVEDLRNFNEHRDWHMIINEYSDMSIGQILQRCRRLDMLVLCFFNGEVDDASLFAWAADEARERSVGKLLAPAVPLKSIIVNMKGPCAVGSRNMLTDAFRGFAPSLSSFYATTGPPEGEEGEEPPKSPAFNDESRGISLPGRPLSIGAHSTLLDDGLLVRCPKLTLLELTIKGSKDRNIPFPSLPVLDLPSLSSMSLSGQAVEMLDPASFCHMPLLESIKISGVWIDSLRSGTGTCWSDRWSWDWSLCELSTLDLQMDSPATMFSFKALRGCPKLKNLYLRFPTDTDEQLHQLEVLSALPNCTQDVFPQLQSLTLEGRYRMQPEDLEALIGRILPGLVTLTLDSLDPCTLRQVVDYTRPHKSLTGVTLCHGPLDQEACQELGFVERPDGQDNDGGCRYTLRQTEWTRSYILRQYD
ncbi:hypothetical protein DFQ27_008253, partial [Actinomortierella ambigua]